MTGMLVVDDSPTGKRNGQNESMGLSDALR